MAAIIQSNGWGFNISRWKHAKLLLVESLRRGGSITLNVLIVLKFVVFDIKKNYI